MHEPLLEFIKHHYNSEAAQSLELLSGGGSSRKYFRFLSQGNSFIVTLNNNIEENQAFIYFANHFSKILPNIPQIIHVSNDETMYIQNDLGNISMIDCVLNDKEKAKPIYKKAIQQLAKLQILGDENLDYSRCFSYPKFNHLLVLRDLFSCKNYFINLVEIPFNQAKLLSDFERFAHDFEQLKFQHFVYRDFQTRNIMLVENEPFFIDFQGGLKGPIQYDLVSILWQAKVNLSHEWKSELYDIYLTEIQKYLPQPIDKLEFQKGYEFCVVERLLQVLGAYGFRGIYEGKKHFIESIEFALKNLSEIQNFTILNNYPELKKVIIELSQNHTFIKIKQIIDERQITHQR